MTSIAPIITDRLLLRPVVDADAQATAALVTPDVAANLSTWPSPMSAEQALERIRQAQDQLTKREAVNLAIIDRDSDRLLGWIGLAHTSPSRARLGYWLGTEFRGGGLMKEAAAAAVPAAGALLQVQTVEALVLTTNAPSIAMLKAIRFSYDGEQTVMLETAALEAQCLRYIRKGPWAKTAQEIGWWS